METSSSEKKAKPTPKSSPHAALRVRKETRKRVLTDLVKVNRKDFGKNVRVDQYIALAISLVTPEHIVQLQEGSLSNADRLEREYRTYIAKHGPISKDDYLGKRLSGEVSTNESSKSDSEDS